MRHPSTPAHRALKSIRWLPIIALTLSLTAPALAQSPPPDVKTAPMPEPNLLQTLEKLAKGQGDHREIVASFEDGSEFHGWTKMRIDKATISLLHSARGNHDPRTYQGVLTRAEAQRLAHLVLKTKLWTVSPSERPGVPGETRPRIVVGLASGPKIQLQGWAGDLAKHPAFAKVRTDLLSIAARISDGKVTY